MTPSGIRSFLSGGARGDQGLAGPDPRPVPAPAMADTRWRPASWNSAWAQTDWCDQPAPWRFDTETSLHHDCPRAAISARQILDQGATTLEIEVGEFEGSYLSLAIQLPPSILAGLQDYHLVGVSADLRESISMPVYARLNLRHGPNLAQVAQVMHGDGARLMAEFELAGRGLNCRNLREGWLDVMFGSPAHKCIRIADLTLYRRPRAGV